MLARSNVTACYCCRRRKQKCDQRFPKCRSCEKAGVGCVSIDSATKRQIPRSYVHSLEERVAYLESKLHQHGIHSFEPDVLGTVRRAVTEVSTATQERAECRTKETVGSISGKLGIEAKSDCALLRPLLRELFRAEAEGSGWFSEDSSVLPVPLPDQLDTAPATLPEEVTRVQLVDVFFELTEFSCPILYRPSFMAQLATLDRFDEQKGAFFAHIEFAISLLTLQKHNTTGVPTTLCERHFATALNSLEQVGLPADVEGVQALLLVALYSYLYPRSFNPWKTIGMAVRLAASLGLHTEPVSEGLDALALDTRRRVFWVAYSMDRTVGAFLRRPLGYQTILLMRSSQAPSPMTSSRQTAYKTAQ
jgi:hypothetical protein